MQWGLYQQQGVATSENGDVRAYMLIQAFRHFGHLEAHFNPLNGKVEHHIELEHGDKELVAKYKHIYCNRIGFEYMGLGHPDLEKWLQDIIESNPDFTLTSD